MTYAKLSSSLLACKEAPTSAPRQGGAAPSIALVPAAAEARSLAEGLRALKLPVFLREYEELGRRCAAEGLDYSRYLLRLAEGELSERHARRVERLVKKAGFPALKSFEEFDFGARPSLDKRLVLELAECGYVGRRENIVAIGGSGTGKTHLALALGLAACRKGHSVVFTTAASLVHELVEARAEKRLVRLERRLDGTNLLVIDDLGHAPLFPGGSELLFEIISRRCERGSIVITSDLPMEEWAGVFGGERLTATVLDRLCWKLHRLDLKGDSYRRAAPPAVLAQLATLRPVEREAP